MMLPSAVSATRCCGCQPVRAVADFDVSRAHRKACRVNGLAPAPPAQASQDIADRRKDANAQSLAGAGLRQLRVLRGVLWGGVAEHPGGLTHPEQSCAHL